MKTKIFGGLLVLAIAAIAAFNMSIRPSLQNSALLTLTTADIEALADTMIIPSDTIDLPEVVIECSTGGCEYCYTIERYFSCSGRYDCYPTGKPKDWCPC